MARTDRLHLHDELLGKFCECGDGPFNRATWEDAVRSRTKTVTRRKGGAFLKPGDRLTLCRKVMGRKPGEPLVRLAEVEVVAVRREPLSAFPWADIDAEGVAWDKWALNDHEWQCPSCAPVAWAGWYARTMGVPIDTAEVTRIEWRYL